MGRLFAGDQLTKKQWESLTRSKQDKYARYAAEITIGKDWVMMVPPYKAETDEPDFDQYPIAAINEPDKSRKANVFTLATKLQMDFKVEGSPDTVPCEFVVISMFVCNDVKAGDELLWNYGSAYQGIREANGNYTPGMACTELHEDEKDAFADESLVRATNLAQKLPDVAFVRKLLHEPEHALEY